MNPPLAARGPAVIGALAGLALTLMVFSHLLGRNALYRVALNIFLGGSVGFALGVVTWEVLVLRIGVPLVVGQRWLVLVPLALGILLTLKLSVRRAYIGNVSVAFLAGVGAAVAIGGALLGSIVPLAGATARAASSGAWPFMPLGWLDAVLLVVGALSALVAFEHVGRPGRPGRRVWSWPARAVGWLGRWFLVIAFGVLFGGAVTTALSIFIGRMQYLIELVGTLAR